MKHPEQTWSEYLRQLLSFLLGMALVIYGVVKPGGNLGILIVGLLLMGIVPVDAFLARIGYNRSTSEPTNVIDTGERTTPQETTHLDKSPSQNG